MSKLIINFMLFVLVGIVEINCGIDIIEINGNRNTEHFNTAIIGGVIHCGVTTCPTGTNCVITQNRDNNDPGKVIITQTCYDSSRNAIKENRVVSDANENQGDVNIIHNKNIGWLW